MLVYNVGILQSEAGGLRVWFWLHNETQKRNKQGESGRKRSLAAACRAQQHPAGAASIRQEQPASGRSGPHPHPAGASEVSVDPAREMRGG